AGVDVDLVETVGHSGSFHPTFEPYRTAVFQQTRSKGAEANWLSRTTTAGMGFDRRAMLAAIAAGVVAAVTRPPVAGAVRLIVPLARGHSPRGGTRSTTGDG